MKTITQNTAYYLQVVFLALVIGIGLQIASAWTPPNSAPPTQTVTAPITASSVAQTKFGAFAATGILSGGMLRTTTTGVTEGTACLTNGLIATDASGVVLSCQSLVWSKAGGSATAELQSQACPPPVGYGANAVGVVSGFDASGRITCTAIVPAVARTGTGGGGTGGSMTCTSGHYSMGGYVCDTWSAPR